jgi:hypothetical protein
LTIPEDGVKSNVESEIRPAPFDNTRIYPEASALSRRLVMGLLCLLLAVFPRPSAAGIFIVHDTTELFNALTAASRNGEEDTFWVMGGVYHLTRPLEYIPVSTEDYPITIGGTPAEKPILDGDHRTSILEIDYWVGLGQAGDSNADITISDMIFRNADGTLWSSSGHGFGALRIATHKADVWVQGCEFYSNHAPIPSMTCPPKTGPGCMLEFKPGSQPGGEVGDDEEEIQGRGDHPEAARGGGRGWPGSRDG